MAQRHLKHDKTLAEAFLGRRTMRVLHESGKLTISAGPGRFVAKKVKPNLSVREIAQLWTNAGFTVKVHDYHGEMPVVVDL